MSCMTKPRIDLTNKQFGKLTVIKQVEDYVKPDGRHNTRWLCKCSCEDDKYCYAITDILTSGRKTSCGCEGKERRIENCRNEITYSRLVESKKNNVPFGDKNPYSRRVAQYDAKGNFIAEFESCGDAFRKTGISRDSIQQCASGKRRFGGSYIWKYTTEAKFSTKTTDKHSFGKKKVCQYSINGNFIREYISIRKAAFANKMHPSQIYHCLNGAYRQSGGYQWSYTKEPKLPRYIKNTEKSSKKEVIVYNEEEVYKFNNAKECAEFFKKNIVVVRDSILKKRHFMRKYKIEYIVPYN